MHKTEQRVVHSSQITQVRPRRAWRDNVGGYVRVSSHDIKPTIAVAVVAATTLSEHGYALQGETAGTASGLHWRAGGSSNRSVPPPFHRRHKRNRQGYEKTI